MSNEVTGKKQSFYSGQMYGTIKYEIFENEWGSTIYLTGFSIRNLPKNLTEREAEIAIRGFVCGHDKAVNDVIKPENALKRIASNQFFKENKPD